MAARHRVTAGRHLGVGRLVRLKQDVPFYLNPCLNGNCPDGPTCDHPGTSPDGVPCCDDILDGLSVGEEDNTKSASDVRLMTSRAAFQQTNGGIETNSFFGLGAINLLVPSHTQIFSENRNEHNDAGKNHSPVINISGNLGYARYRKGMQVHDPMPTASYDEVKKIMGSTPAMSMGKSSFRIDGVSTKEDSGGIAFAHDNRIEEVVESKDEIIPSEDPRFNFTDIHPLDRNSTVTSFVIDKDADIAGRALQYERGVARHVDSDGTLPEQRSMPLACSCQECCGDGCGEINLCLTPQQGCADDCPDSCDCFICDGGNNCCDDFLVDPCEGVLCNEGCVCVVTEEASCTSPGNYQCQKVDEDGDPTGEDCNADPCANCFECCINQKCADVDECGVCNGNGPDACPECGGDCTCSGDCSGCVEEDECGVCGGDGPIVCSDPTPCGGGCPPAQCSAEIICENGCPSPGCEGECEERDICGVCGGGGCDKSKNECCNGVGDSNAGCTWCDDCIPNQEVIIKKNEVQSLIGNYKDHDLVPLVYIKHDLNAGHDTNGSPFAGNTQNQSAIGPRDTVMSCVLELTVADVFGRVAFTGAAPFVNPLKLSVYKIKDGIPLDMSYVDCEESANTRDWTSDSGRNATDRDLVEVTSVTVGDDVKPGDKIYFDLSELARSAVHNNEGVMKFMIEASDWFAESTGLTPAARTNNHPSMLLKFHAGGVMGPAVKTTVNQGLRSAHSRVNPAVLRKRAAAGL